MIRGGGPGAEAPRIRIAPLLAAAAAGLGPAPVAVGAGADAAAPVQPAVAEAAAAMAGTERYCTGYETTFHGEWKGGTVGEAGDTGAAASPVPFRIGVNAGGEGCYAQLGVRAPPGVAPYELPRFRATAREGGVAWTLRYRDIVLNVDTASGTAVRRQGSGAAPPWSGTLLPGPPPVADPPPAPAKSAKERWYGRWRGRFPGVPFRISLRFSASDSEAGGVRGRISSFLMAKTFTGRFHGEMLVFRWRNRHVGLVMERGGDALVYTDYRGRVSRFRRKR